VGQVASDYFQPLIVLAIIAAIVFVVGRVVSARGNKEGGERIVDLAFGVSLLAGAYVVILLILAALDEPDLIWDALVIILIISVFFLGLLLLLFGVFELLLSRGPKRARESD
jgi:hypothetical protein